MQKREWADTADLEKQATMMWHERSENDRLPIIRLLGTNP